MGKRATGEYKPVGFIYGLRNTAVSSSESSVSDGSMLMNNESERVWMVTVVI